MTISITSLNPPFKPLCQPVSRGSIVPAVPRQARETAMLLFDDTNPMKLDPSHAPFNVAYLQRIAQVLYKALQDHPQTTVIRVDLHLPEDGDVGDSIISDADLSQG